jgi:hypothetical protein
MKTSGEMGIQNHILLFQLANTSRLPAVRIHPTSNPLMIRSQIPLRRSRSTRQNPRRPIPTQTVMPSCAENLESPNSASTTAPIAKPSL